MAPKDAKKKDVAFRRWDKSLEPSGSVEQYLIILLRAAVFGVIRRVTRG